MAESQSMETTMDLGTPALRLPGGRAAVRAPARQSAATTTELESPKQVRAQSIIAVGPIMTPVPAAPRAESIMAEANHNFRLR
jgi:hypothetical protein